MADIHPDIRTAMGLVPVTWTNDLGHRCTLEPDPDGGWTNLEHMPQPSPLPIHPAIPWGIDSFTAAALMEKC